MNPCLFKYIYTWLAYIINTFDLYDRDLGIKFGHKSKCILYTKNTIGWILWRLPRGNQLQNIYSYVVLVIKNVLWGDTI